MYYSSRRQDSSAVLFSWYFEDDNDEEIEVEIYAVCYPEEKPHITADPYYSHDGSPAFAEIEAKGLTRELTPQEEYDICEKEGKWFDDVECEAFDRADDESESARDAYNDMKMQEWKESRTARTVIAVDIFAPEEEHVY